MFLTLAVVVNSHTEHVAVVPLQGLGVAFVFNLVESNCGTLVYFELNNYGWFVGFKGDV